MKKTCEWDNAGDNFSHENFREEFENTISTIVTVVIYTAVILNSRDAQKETEGSLKLSKT